EPAVRGCRTLVFKTSAFDRSATPPSGGADASRGRRVSFLTAVRQAADHGLHCLNPRRGGRVAEGTRLLSEYGVHAPSRVRIPPSPLLRKACKADSYGRRAHKPHQCHGGLVIACLEAIWKR